MAYIFQFVNMMFHIDWFAYIEESLHSWNKPYLIMVCEFFDVLLNSVWLTFVEDFCIYVHQWYWPVVFFFVCFLCLVLVWGCWWLHRMSLEVFLPLQFFERVLEGQALAIVYIFNRILLWSHLVLGFYFGGRFLIMASISVLIIGSFIISISSCSVLEDWTFLRICPFLPGYLFYCHRVVHNSLL